jgi:hypothetical protein
MHRTCPLSGVSGHGLFAARMSATDFFTSAACSGGFIEKGRACGGSTIPLNLSTASNFGRVTTVSRRTHICVSSRPHLRLAALTFVMTMSPAISIIAVREMRAKLRVSKLLLSGAVSITLIGCSCPIPPQVIQKACTSKGCFYRTAAGSPIELKRASFNIDSGQSRQKTKTPVATKMDVPASAQLSGVSDPILSKATSAVAAKMDDPASIEFEDMKRAVRKDTFGQQIDTICGHVRGKKASGEETGERPFLYVVGENKAFIDDGNPDSLGAIAYRAICINPDLRGQDSRQQPSRE